MWAADLGRTDNSHHSCMPTNPSCSWRCSKTSSCQQFDYQCNSIGPFALSLWSSNKQSTAPGSNSRYSHSHSLPPGNPAPAAPRRLARSSIEWQSTLWSTWHLVLVCHPGLRLQHSLTSLSAFVSDQHRKKPGVECFHLHPEGTWLSDGTICVSDQVRNCPELRATGQGHFPRQSAGRCVCLLHSAKGAVADDDFKARHFGHFRASDLPTCRHVRRTQLVMQLYGQLGAIPIAA